MVNLLDDPEQRSQTIEKEGSTISAGEVSQGQQKPEQTEVEESPGSSGLSSPAIGLRPVFRDTGPPGNRAAVQSAIAEPESGLPPAAAFLVK
jgi:hypothetical protein